MTLRLAHASVGLALVAALAVAGCGSKLVRAGLARAAGPGASPAIQPAAGAEAIWLTLPGRGVKFSMALLDVDGDVKVWAAKDASQVALREGVLISTRGFGRDLISASVPSLATLRAGGDYPRSYYDLDGTDTTIRHVFACHTGPEASDDPQVRHIVEVCSGDMGQIRNEFWFDVVGNLIKSRQWVSQGVGYAAVEKNEG